MHENIARIQLIHFEENCAVFLALTGHIILKVSRKVQKPTLYNLAETLPLAHFSNDLGLWDSFLWMFILPQ